MQIYMQPTADSRTALAADLQLIGVGAHFWDCGEFLPRFS